MNELVESDEEINAADDEIDYQMEGDIEDSDCGSLWDSDEERF